MGNLPSFAGMNNLERVSMRSMKLTGTIPATIAQLPQLRYLDLAFNHLHGPIPEFSNTQLRRLILAVNNLTGEIPATLSTNTNLQVLCVF